MRHQVELLPRKESHDDPEKRKLDRTNEPWFLSLNNLKSITKCLVSEKVYTVSKHKKHMYSAIKIGGGV